MIPTTKYVFFGTPEFAESVLRELIDAKLPPALVVCNPDRPVGREKTITPPLTKVLAKKHGIEVWQPEDMKGGLEKLGTKDEYDFFVVAAYGKILPQALLNLPRLGVVGVHPSLLPKYRGASPIQSVILAGETETGVSLFMVDELVDHGPVIAQEKIPVAPNENYLSLEAKLARLGGQLMAKTIPNILSGQVTLNTQIEEYANLTKKFDSKNSYVDITNDNPIVIERMIRALNPEPGVWTDRYVKAMGKRVKLLEAKIEKGKLILKKIHVEGGKPQSL